MSNIPSTAMMMLSSLTSRVGMIAAGSTYTRSVIVECFRRQCSRSHRVLGGGAVASKTMLEGYSFANRDRKCRMVDISRRHDASE